jgi:hypothetical protein
MSIKKFNTKIQKEGKFTFIAIPFSPRDIWGAKPRYYVTGTINGHPVRGCLGASGHEYFLRLSSTWMRENKVVLEKTVHVQLSSEDR